MSEPIVITRGSSFLGSHVSKRLVADGCRVICLDNFCTGTPDNVAHLTEDLSVHPPGRGQYGDGWPGHKPETRPPGTRPPDNKKI